jgi:hypothetical protein
MRRILLVLVVATVVVTMLALTTGTAFASVEEGGGPPGIDHSQGPTASALPGLENALGNHKPLSKKEPIAWLLS